MKAVIYEIASFLSGLVSIRIHPRATRSGAIRYAAVYPRKQQATDTPNENIFRGFGASVVFMKK